jgi:hypothetical protein
MHYHIQTKTFIMKRLTLVLLVVTSFTYTGCVKELFKKKDKEAKVVAPEEKYFGTTWKATKIAIDANGNNAVEANEIYRFTGTSSYELKADKKFTFVYNYDGDYVTMAGNWTLSLDQKNILIDDESSTNDLSLDYKSDTEFQTELLKFNGFYGWLFYTKQ